MATENYSQNIDISQQKEVQNPETTDINQKINLFSTFKQTIPQSIMPIIRDSSLPDIRIDQNCKSVTKNKCLSPTPEVTQDKILVYLQQYQKKKINQIIEHYTNSKKDKGNVQYLSDSKISNKQKNVEDQEISSKQIDNALKSSQKHKLQQLKLIYLPTGKGNQIKILPEDEEQHNQEEKQVAESKEWSEQQQRQSPIGGSPKSKQVNSKFAYENNSMLLLQQQKLFTNNYNKIKQPPIHKENSGYADALIDISKPATIINMNKHIRLKNESSNLANQTDKKKLKEIQTRNKTVVNTTKISSNTIITFGQSSKEKYKLQRTGIFQGKEQQGIGYIPQIQTKNLEENIFHDSSPKQMQDQLCQSPQQQNKNREGQESPMGHQQMQTPIYTKLNNDIQENNQENQDEQSCQFKITKKIKLYPFIKDIEQWKKKQQLGISTQVFVVLGGYWDLKRALRQRGWVENPDPQSPCFDWKWTLLSKDINYMELLPNQKVNHFSKISKLTTKIGILRSLRQLQWFAKADYNSFFPRCYDLNDPEDLEQFISDFQITRAEAILKSYRLMFSSNDADRARFYEQAQVAYEVCRRRTIDENELLDCQQSLPYNLIDDQEWEILQIQDPAIEDQISKKYEKWIKDKFSQTPLNTNPETSKKSNDINQNIYRMSKQVDFTNKNKVQKNQSDAEFINNIDQLLNQLKKSNMQFNINGSNNIWIMKPAGLSRGRGITIENNLIDILQFIKQREQQSVIQKYIENPLIIFNRKFDIRQWVLITDWNPLTIWVYAECYVRFSAHKYDKSDLQDIYSHLTNNSISKHAKCQEIGQGNMITQQALQQYLKSLENNNGEDVFASKVQPQMMNAIIQSIQCVQDSIETRKNSHELLGYDFMIDEDYHVWLIEVNSSPAMDYSTPITKHLVKLCLEDLVKVIIDYPQQKLEKKQGEANQQQLCDTGNWKLLYQGPIISEKIQNSITLDFLCEGRSINPSQQ